MSGPIFVNFTWLEQDEEWALTRLIHDFGGWILEDCSDYAERFGEICSHAGWFVLLLYTGTLMR